jgi:A/G-specific adenine glycosylase
VATRQRLLLDWYDRHGRDLPWRHEPTLFATWIAEIMLQQTTVRAVLPRWSVFLRRFPDVQSLAAASEEEVLAAWSGLGYYRRARHLHRAARSVVASGGALPRTREGWRALPGVGDYAAGAIASIGLGLPEPAVDANVRRVFTRWLCAQPRDAANLTPARVRQVAAQHVPVARPGDWNQALMDLGSAICRADRVACRECPVRTVCAAGQSGLGEEIPTRIAREPTRSVVLGMLLLRHGPRVLTLPSDQAVVMRPRGLGRPLRADLAGLFAGMVCWPTTPWYAGPADNAPRTLAGGWQRWLRRLGWRDPVVQAAGSQRHAITVYRLRVEVAVAIWPGTGSAPQVPGAIWAPWPAEELPLPSLARRCLTSVSRT